MSARSKAVKDIGFQQRLGKGLLLVGVIALIAGVFVFRQSQPYYRTALRARGQIVEVEQRKTREGVTCFPRFSYVDQAGVTQVVHARFGYSATGLGLARQYAVGDAVEVIYSPDAPEYAQLNDTWSLWGWTILVGGGGFVLASAGVVLWRGAISWRRGLA